MRRFQSPPKVLSLQPARSTQRMRLTKCCFWRRGEALQESKAQINYPHLQQEHSFKGYTSDHNLSGLCFLLLHLLPLLPLAHLLSPVLLLLLRCFTSTHAERKLRAREGRKVALASHLLLLMASAKALLFLINQPNEYRISCYTSINSDSLVDESDLLTDEERRRTPEHL